MADDIEIKEIKCKTILNPSKLSDYSINPYFGCEHGCKYCYAKFMTKYGNKKIEDWGAFVHSKANAPEILRKQAKKARPGSIYLSSVCDAYQPLEAKHKITRNMLGILLREKDKFPISIQTKSDLVLRDLDIIKQFKKAEVGFTLTILDSKLAKEIEPKTSSPSKRIRALKILKEKGIKTFVFLGPILPYLTDSIDIIKKTMKYTDYYFFDRLNLKPGVWEALEPFLKERGLEKQYREILFFNNNYFEKEKKKIVSFCNKNKIKYIFCY